MNPIIVFDNQA